jgi:serine/threonine protein kinase
LREARVASAAAPAAVVVYDVLSTPAGIGIVMELVPRGSLVSAVRAGTAPQCAYDLGRAAVESMATVHASGVMHLDLHPGNLLVRGDRSVAVADFGLARLRAARGFSRGGHELVWTAPEILDFGVASPQADVFALGLVLRWIERRSGVTFGAVLARACSPDRRVRPADAGALLAELAARPTRTSAGGQG